MTTKASLEHNVTNSTSHTLIITGTVLLASAPLLLYHYAPRIFLTYKSYQSRRRLRSLTQNANPQQSNTTPQDPPTVSGIYIHPVKSLRPVSLTSTSFDKHGLKSDRRLMIVRPNPTPIYGSFIEGEATHRFVTQRQCSKLATISVSPPIELEHGKLMIKLSCELTEEHVYINVAPRSIRNLPVRYLAGVWSDTLRVADVGDEAAAFVAKVAMLEDASFADVRVVAILEESERRVEEIYCPEEARVGFGSLPQSGLTDGFPILIATESSLAELNKRLSEKNKNKIPMSRFRPNIVICNTEPFEEDTWKAIQIGTGPNSTILLIAKGCPRCKQSCTDQLTGERSEEPLETLAEFRALGKNEEDVYFAQNAVLIGDGYRGVISVGDEVRILTRGDPVWDLGSVAAE
ncbi:hypothetical protein HJC23_002093 [Cyclotella cryptica]|uniref:MOSC domain-containing protein n=1 Tax=Cyclotella cryptica TaxID=29204 RepID=A0ABD3P723_9STRA|eukprot:CCRYP_017098-RA/>CCRYP_017098-RA protein AED:0.16 eAED:0.16 QI:111/1/1/1/1/1/3/2095/403